MEDILSRAKSLNIEFEKQDQEILNRLSGLQYFLEDAECQRASVEAEGIDTTLQDKVIENIREEIRDLSRQIR